MSFPKIVTRLTGHAKPRCQVYQPGFNPDNSCWLEGSWVTVPNEGWEVRKAAHEALYGNLRALAKDDHYRNPPTPIEALTPAQRQAFEHYCGNQHLDCRRHDGHIGPVSVEMAGGHINGQAIRWLRQKGYQVFRQVVQHGVIIDQTRFEVPEDLLAPDTEPVNTWDHVVRQNRAREKSMFDGLVAMVGTPQDRGVTFGDAPPVSFAAAMAFQSLIMAEEGIIRAAHHEQKHGTPMPHHDLATERAEYAEKRRVLKATFSDEDFTKGYEQTRATHNTCARANLDNSDGHLYSYVLPKFNDDGTHEPWGDRDVPWNAG